MSAAWIWAIAAAVLVGAELLVGNFYLLAVGLAFALGAIAAWLGATVPVQMAIAAVLGVLLTVLAHQWRLKHALPGPQVPFDVGQAVEIQAWHPDGTARVAYRGSHWDAELESPDTPRAATMTIVAMRGSTLVLGARRA